MNSSCSFMTASRGPSSCAVPTAPSAANAVFRDLPWIWSRTVPGFRRIQVLRAYQWTLDNKICFPCLPNIGMLPQLLGSMFRCQDHQRTGSTLQLVYLSQVWNLLKIQFIPPWCCSCIKNDYCPSSIDLLLQYFSQPVSSSMLLIVVFLVYDERQNLRTSGWTLSTSLNTFFCQSKFPK